MNKYCEILNAIESGELTHPIPTYKFNNFFFVRVVDQKLAVVTPKGKVLPISEVSFHNFEKKFVNGRFIDGVKLNTKDKYLYPILRELDNTDDSYTPIDWKKLSKYIEELTFEDFVAYLRENSQTEAFKEFEGKNNCIVLFKNDSIEIRSRDDSKLLYCFTIDSFNDIKSKVVEFFNNISLEDLFEIFTAGVELYQKIRGEKYTEVFCEICCEICCGIIATHIPIPIPMPISDFIAKKLGEWLAKELNEKVDLDKKIKEFLRKKFPFICEKIPRGIDHKKTKKIYSKIIKK